MSVDMVLNSLSLSTPVSDTATARTLMSELILVLSTASRLGVKTLRTQDNVYTLVLAQDYPVSKWFQDRQVDRVERQFFLGLATKTPLLKDTGITTAEDKISLAEYICNGKVNNALGIAYLLNALVISFCSDVEWDCDQLHIEITRLEDSNIISDADLGLKTTYERLIHASKKEHVLNHKTAIQTLLSALPWDPHDELLPCYVTENQKMPMFEWLESLSDGQARDIIIARFNQAKRGNLGDYRAVGDEVYEFRFFFGPGYRVYFGSTKTQKILLFGGDKGSQTRDIKQAKENWKDYKRRNL